MSAISKSFLSFWRGIFNWKLLWQYWLSVKEHVWEALWGAGLVGIPFAIYTLYASPSLRFLGWVIAWCIFVAGYFAWRGYYLRLEKKIKIRLLPPQEWDIPPSFAEHARAYYFEVTNTSEGDTIENVNVQLRKTEPAITHLDWLPVHLHVKHDNPIRQQDQLRQFDLNPQELRNIDFISGVDGDEKFKVIHVLWDINSSVPRNTESQQYRFQVMITAKAMPAVFVWFRVWMDVDGILHCEMENENTETTV